MPYGIVSKSLYFDEVWADEQHEAKKEFLEEKEKRDVQRLKNIMQSGVYGIDTRPYEKGCDTHAK